jgi:hypothetical protein
METINNTIWVYSVFSGEMCDFPENDMSLLDIGHLPLVKKPNSSCKKCYGRMNLGRDAQNYAYVPCSCLRKVINFDILKSLESIQLTK